jgi:hypothetical protein
LDAEFEELLGDGVAETRLESVVAACRRWAGWMPGNDEYAQERAFLDDLEFADLRTSDQAHISISSQGVPRRSGGHSQ